MTALTSDTNESLRRAAAAWREGRTQVAHDLCEAILQSRSDDIDALNLKGMSLYALDRKPEALTVLQAALSRRERADLHNNLALVHKSLDSPAEAHAHFLSALAMKPDYAEAHANFGRLLRATGNRGGAIARLQRALALGWEHANVHEDLATLFSDADDLESAEAHLKRWLALELPTAKSFPPPEPPATPARSLPFGEALAAMAQTLGEAGLAFFIGDGTALGCVRDGGFISFDKDIDFGMADDAPRAAVVKALDESPEFWFDRRAAEQTQDLYVTTRYRDLVAIDIYFYKRAGAYAYHGLSWGVHRMLWRQSAFGLREVEFLGLRLNLPDPIEPYLNELYGPSWRTPDPDFCAFVTGDIVDGLPLMGRVHAMFALKSALGVGRRGKAVAVARGLAARMAFGAQDAALRGALVDFVARFDN